MSMPDIRRDPHAVLVTLYKGEAIMKTFIGNGTGAAESAVNQALKGLESPSAIIFMAPYGALETAAGIIMERFPDTPSIGTIGTKFHNGIVGDTNIVVLGFFEDAKISCGVMEHIDLYPAVSIRKVEKSIAEIAPGKDNSVCVEFCTCAEEMLVTTLFLALQPKGIPMIGGSAFGAPDGKASIVACNGKVYENACVYALIKNTTGRIRVYKENIYSKASDQCYYATKVDTKRKALIQIDNRPAADVYSEALNVRKEDIIGNVLQNPIGRVVGDQVFISSMREMGANGELVNFKQINRNDCIYFLKRDDYDQIEKETRRQIQADAHRISLVISVDCIYRYLLYQQEHYLDTYRKDMAALGNWVGVVTGGEQFNNQHVNQTMVCAVFED